jgi:hypothetical protein
MPAKSWMRGGQREVARATRNLGRYAAGRLGFMMAVVVAVLAALLVPARGAEATAPVTVTDDAFGYPYFNQPGFPGNDPSGVMATCVTGNEADCQDPISHYAYDWGYETTCPASDPECMRNGLEITVNGHNWGMSDPWGYSLRNCTSYVAWKLASLGVNPAEFEHLGNGGDWYNKSPASRRSKTPAYGDAAVQPATKSNPFGHVAFVEAVHSNGTITVSEYNYHENGTGDKRSGSPSSWTLGCRPGIPLWRSPASRPSTLAETLSLRRYRARRQGTAVPAGCTNWPTKTSVRSWSAR